MKAIQQWFAEMSAAGLLLSCEQAYNIYACQTDWFECWHIKFMKKNQRDPFSTIVIPYSIIPKNNINVIQLRKDSKDLVKLEWQKPTEEDVGKMCWFMDEKNESIIFEELERIHKGFYFGVDCWCYQFCLLATHGRLCPETSDFEEK